MSLEFGILIVDDDEGQRSIEAERTGPVKGHADVVPGGAQGPWAFQDDPVGVLGLGQWTELPERCSGGLPGLVGHVTVRRDAESGPG